MRVHDSLAVVGHVPADFLGAERAGVEANRFVGLAVADGEVRGDTAARALLVPFHADSPCQVGVRSV